MSKFLALHDRRLLGLVPPQRELAVVNLTPTTPLGNAFRAIRENAERIPIKALFVFCHGYSGINRRERVSLDAGGMGLQLGKEEVMHHNVSMWRAIRDKVEMIVVYSCAAADTQPGNAGTTADGRYLMGALAIYTNAVVYAADKIQHYLTGLDRRHGHVDFGPWEGTILKFAPGGQSPQSVKGTPWKYGVPIKRGDRDLV